MRESSKKISEETFVQIDFDEFDEIIMNAKGVNAVISNDDDEFDYDDSDFDIDDEELNLDDYLDDCSDEPDIGTLISVDDEEVEAEEFPPELSDKTIEEMEEDEDDKEEELEEDITPPDEIDESIAHVKSGKSMAEMYEIRKNRQRNKLVEALLVDNTVETIENVLKSTLKSHGISHAESIVTIGLILDKMLNATDEDIAAPEFLGGIINKLVDNKDIQDLVKNAVEQALESEAPQAPGLTDVPNTVVIVSSEDEQTPQVIEDSPEDN